MSRPRKCRRVGGLPGIQHFGPLAHGTCQCNYCCDAVVMTVDEFEAIRLIDHLALTQEECAERMAIARTTVQRIYDEARKKLARCLVEGHGLRIEGGDYTVDNSSLCESSCCRQAE